MSRQITSGWGMRGILGQTILALGAAGVAAGQAGCVESSAATGLIDQLTSAIGAVEQTIERTDEGADTNAPAPGSGAPAPTAGEEQARDGGGPEGAPSGAPEAPVDAPTADSPDAPLAVDDAADGAANAALVAELTAALANKHIETGRSSGGGGSFLTSSTTLELCANGIYASSETTIFSGATPDSFLDADSTRNFLGRWSVQLDGAGQPLLVLQLERGVRDGEASTRTFLVATDAGGALFLDGAQARVEDRSAECGEAAAVAERAEQLFADFGALFNNKRVTFDMLEVTDIGSPDVRSTDMALCASGTFQAAQSFDEGFSRGPDLADGAGAWRVELDPFAGVLLRLEQASGSAQLFDDFFFVERTADGRILFSGFLSRDSSRSIAALDSPLIGDGIAFCP